MSCDDNIGKVCANDEDDNKNNGLVADSEGLVVVVSVVWKGEELDVDNNEEEEKKDDDEDDNVDDDDEEVIDIGAGRSIKTSPVRLLSPINGIALRLFDESVNFINFLLTPPEPYPTFFLLPIIPVLLRFSVSLFTDLIANGLLAF